jgi:hypothetical protein
VVVLADIAGAGERAALVELRIARALDLATLGAAPRAGRPGGFGLGLSATGEAAMMTSVDSSPRYAVSKLEWTDLCACAGVLKVRRK